MTNRPVLEARPPPKFLRVGLPGIDQFIVPMPVEHSSSGLKDTADAGFQGYAAGKHPVVAEDPSRTEHKQAPASAMEA